jgi:hypothetical protein
MRLAPSSSGCMWTSDNHQLFEMITADNIH